MSDKEKYEELCEALVGIDATERYTHEDILSYVYNASIITSVHEECHRERGLAESGDVYGRSPRCPYS